MTTPQEEFELQILEHIYAYDHGLSGGAGLGALYEMAGGDENAVSRAASGLKARGLIRDEDRFSGGYHIEAEGRQVVEELRVRRADRGRRRLECREQLLRWVDSQAESISARMARSDFDGTLDLVPFTAEESEVAADFLTKKALLNSNGSFQESHYALMITDLGRECIDSGMPIDQFMRRNDNSSSTLNVFGSGNNVAAAFGDNNVVKAKLESFNHDQAVQFAETLRQSLPALPGLDETEVEVLLAQIEQREDPGVAQRATHRLGTILADTTSGGLGGVLAAMAMQALGMG